MHIKTYQYNFWDSIFNEVWILSKILDIYADIEHRWPHNFDISSYSYLHILHT